MNYFHTIRLENFRNFQYFEANFIPGCNVLIGKNGSGKTNILESLSLFEKGRGFRKDNIQNLSNNKSSNNNFNISSIFFNNKSKINLSLFNQTKNNSSIKRLLVNGDSSINSIKYFENIFSIIYFLPEMERLFLNSPSARRNFLDRLIYGADQTYNRLINNYKKYIYERYKILKNYKYNAEWIKNLEKKIVDLGIEIYKKRYQHIQIINSNLVNLDSYQKYSYKISLSIKDDLINKDNEDLNNIYDQYLSKLEKTREVDMIVGGTKFGPHKSDIIGYNIHDNFNVNQLSTGQQKSIILLIILAQCNFLIKEKEVCPVIFFDEVCSHLDLENRELLLNLIESLNIQIFITGTEKKFFSFLSTKTSYCNITER